MDTIRKLFGSNRQIFVGSHAIGVDSGPRVDMFSLICKVVLRYVQTGKIEHSVNGLSGFLVELLRTDAAAKWDWFMRKASKRDYATSVGWLSVVAILPLWCAKKWYSRLAVGLLVAPACITAAYATLPREKLSVYRLRSEAIGHMEDEEEAVECLKVEPAREIKGKDGEDIITGSRMTKVVAKTGRPRRRPYAAKIAQVARAKVGYLKNSPENRLIYQRVLIEIMDKDCVRYCDRDAILPLAIGCCFVYPEGTEEASQLWGSTESLGVK
nr:MAG: hypothetical protein [Tombusvirus sp.]